MSPAENSADRNPPQRLRGLLAFLVSVLVAARYFLPAESTALGETVWIVQLWLVAGVCWFWLAARSGQPLRRFDGLDLGLSLLIGGHVLSAIFVLLTEGDRRAALNMLWEWLGIGISALLIRETVSEQAGRRQLLCVLVLSAVTLSGLGLWQHYVWYPQISDRLTELKELNRSVPSGPLEAAAREQRLDELSGELGFEGFADNPAARELFRARILHSTEPIGRFALANTFAGLLLVGLILGIGGLIPKRTEPALGWRDWTGFVLIALLGYCFWLTKSRTAWLGLTAGLLTWGALSWRSRRVGTGLLRIGGLLLLVLVISPMIASLLGGLDRQVITEAPKSLQYRLEYWSATGRVIREAPWMGVGPGNFRQAYLRHKLPGSSEEVLDPHNLFLDVWANGGLLALAGLLVILWAIWRALIQLKQQEPEPPAEGATERIAGTLLQRALVGGLALGIATFAELFNGAGISGHGWALLFGWCGVSLLWPSSRSFGRAGLLSVAAAAALIVHLMGAGGIAMPAILQTLVILASCAMSESHASRQLLTSESAAGAGMPWRAISGAAACLSLAIACALTATLPVSEARTQTQVGRVLVTRPASTEAGLSAFQNAIEADSLAHEPWQELALALMKDLNNLAGTDEGLFTRAVSAQQEAIRRNPHSAHLWQSLGRMWWRRYEVDQNLSAAEEAFEAFQQAVERYPNLATLQVEYAQSAAAVGRTSEAQEAAELALRLDQLNRTEGHFDKYLPEPARKRAESIIQQGL